MSTPKPLLQFCSIIPPKLVGKLASHPHLFTSEVTLSLAHLIDDTPIGQLYINTQKNIIGRQAKYRIMDNSAFEMYSAGLPMFDPEQLIERARAINATYIVLPDYPAAPYHDTIAAALQYAPKFKDAGFKTFFVPQTSLGTATAPKIEEYCASFAWAASSPLIDYIGISIIAAPNVYGVYHNHLQRFFARSSILRELLKRGLLAAAVANEKKIHILGMLDGPNEINLLCDLAAPFISSWDSSAPAWYGYNGRRFDLSPTGSVRGKFDKHVDFTASFDGMEENRINELVLNILHNHDVIERIFSEYRLLLANNELMTMLGSGR